MPNELQQQQQYVMLAELPVNDPRRERSLISQCAEVRNLQGLTWRVVEPRWAIARATYNSLGEGWTLTSEFRVPV